MSNISKAGTEGGRTQISSTTRSSGEEVTLITNLNTGETTSLPGGLNTSTPPTQASSSSQEPTGRPGNPVDLAAARGPFVTPFNYGDYTPSANVAGTNQEVAKPALNATPTPGAAPGVAAPAATPAAATSDKQEVDKETPAAITPLQQAAIDLKDFKQKNPERATSWNEEDDKKYIEARTQFIKNGQVPIAGGAVDFGVNHNTEEFERDSGGKLTDIKKASTVDSAFGLGKRTKGSFDIGRFKAEVSSADSILPTHSFLVVFAPMPWAIKRYPQAGNLDSILTMRCDNVILPSINLLQEQNIRRYGFGPVENVAYGVNVGDFTLQFIVDKKAHVVGFFEAWLNRIVNRYSYGGADMNTVTDGRTPYEIAYKDTYACSSVNVFMYDRSQNNVFEYNIYDVFPTGIQSMNMSWSEENTLMKLSVTFSFTDLRIQQSAEKDKAGVGFGSSVDMKNTLLTGPKMTDAEMRALTQGGILVSDGKGGIGFDPTPGTVKVSGDYGFESGSVTPVQSSAASTARTFEVRAPTNLLVNGTPYPPA
jgi:hypothetical protein